jgi:hypothetical protein
MPSYLDFDATKRFRDELLSKTLNAPNGPQTFSSSNYPIQKTNSFPNKDQGDVILNQQTSRDAQIISTGTSNRFAPENGDYVVVEDVRNITSIDNVGVYPYFPINSGILGRGLIGALDSKNYEFESKLAKFANYHISESPDGPVQARIRQNLQTSTLGRVRALDALNGNLSTAINLVTGKEKLIERNYKITVAKTLPGKLIDFIQTVAGVEFPFSEIPGDYLTNPANPVINRPVPKTEFGKIFQDATGVLGSLLGIQRRPKASRKPSDLMLEYLSDGQKGVLYDNLSFSTYAPNYTTAARSQNSSKIFNFVDRIAGGINRLIGREAPAGKAYIGDDRGDDVKNVIADFNDNKTRSPYYLSLMFDETATRLFHSERNISERGPIPGKLTWYSPNSKNKLGVHNLEYQSESSVFEETLSTKHTFRDDSILGKTQELLNSLPKDGGLSRSHVANVIDQTSRIFREGDTLLSRGSAIKYIDKATGKQDGTEYCRVWTKDRSYMNYSDTMKRTGLIRKVEDSVLSTPWNLNIAPMSNGNGSFDKSSTNIDAVAGKVKKYMFSLENLSWKTSNKFGYTYNDLPYCERGPNGGRVMWFPPYDLKVNETNSASWDKNNFLGRPEPIYTYQNTERSGTVSFKVIVDHPSILNLLIKEISDEQAEEYLNSVFAGCQDIDFYTLVRKYTTLDRSDLELIQAYLEYYRDGKTVDISDSLEFINIAGESTVTPETTTGGSEASEDRGKPITYTGFLYFPNDIPFPQDDIYANEDYGKVYSGYTKAESKTLFNTKLNSELTKILTVNTPDNKSDVKTIYGSETPTETTSALVTRTQGQITSAFQVLEGNYASLTTSLEAMKSELVKNNLKYIDIKIESSTSFVADDKYNIKLSYRRSDSILKHVLKTLSKNNDIPSTISKYWKKTKSELEANPAEVQEDLKLNLKDLGYGDDVTGDINISFTNKGENATRTGPEGYDCHKQEIKNTGGLKKYAPVTFYCRSVDVKIDGYPKPSQIPAKPGTVIPGKTEYGSGKTEIKNTTIEKNRKPPLDVVKKLIMKTLSECFYFKKLEETDPVVFNSLKQKFRYFHPAFHSMTPEGLNARLTFLQQCIRPGDTIPIKGLSVDSESNIVDARNTTFGPPPVCVLRIGDFYHSKIVITNLNITFENSTWDLNPEGIGVQPMIADVTLQINFIGGQGIKEPVAKLQNALSSNFYANTEIYDYRADSTVNKDDLKNFNIDFLEKLVGKVKTPDIAGIDTSQNPKKEGKYIGTLTTTQMSYQQNRDDLLAATNEYFDKFKDTYNKLLKTYGNEILPLFISPTYRTINQLDVQNTISTTTQITLLGNYKKTRDFTNLYGRLETKLLEKVSASDHNIVLDFDMDLGSTKYERSRAIIDPYIKKTVTDFLNSIKDEQMIKELETNRNKFIEFIDGFNFIMETNGKDARIDKETTTVVSLTDFNVQKLYEQYDEVVNLVKDKHSMFTAELNTSIDFADPSFTDDLYKQLLAFIIKNNVDKILKEYENSPDNKLFDKNAINKIERRLNKFIKKALDIDEKKFKYKKVQNKKEFKPYAVTITGSITGPQQEKLNNVHGLKDNSTESKLNFSKVIK